MRSVVLLVLLVQGLVGLTMLGYQGWRALQRRAAARARRQRADAETQPQPRRWAGFEGLPSRSSVVAGGGAGFVPPPPPPSLGPTYTSPEHAPPEAPGPTTPVDADVTQAAIPRPIRRSPPGGDVTAAQRRSEWAAAWSADRASTVPGADYPHPTTLAAVFDAVLGPQRVRVALERRAQGATATARVVYVVTGDEAKEAEGWVIDQGHYASGAELVADVRALAELWRHCPGLVPR